MAAAPGAVFVSYRRADTGYAAGRIGDKLIERLGRDAVFVDVETIRPGDDFLASITRAAGSCRVLLALIGEDWVTAADRGGRRLDDPDDVVALEIATALESRATIIPVLVDRTDMPKAGDLPGRLQPLVRYNAVRVDQATFHFAVDALVERIHKILATSHPVRDDESITEPVRARPATDRSRWRRTGFVAPVFLAAVGVVAAAVALISAYTRTDQEAGSTAGTAPTTVELQPVEDRGSTVRLTWTGPTGLDYAVAVAPEGVSASPTLAGRVNSATVAVDPARQYCARVSATDGGKIVSSNVQPVRGANCPGT